MIMIIKKRKIMSFFTLILAVVSVVSIRDYYSSVTVSYVPSYKKVIVIDAGHGSPDGGAVGINGTVEKDINLKIASKLQSLLERSGAKVIVTRSDDNAIPEDKLKSVRDIKKSDMKNRRDFRENYGADMFVSIHMNKYPSEKVHGAQVFYSSSPDESKILGEAIQGELKLICDPQNNRVAKKADKNIYILKESSVPAVIVECGFLSNKAEEQKLNTDKYQSQIAWAIYSGIQKYYEQ